MENSNNNNTGKIIGALLIGTAIGGTLGVLFAPDKGVRTRKKLMSKGEDISDILKDKFQDFVEDVKKEVEIAKEKAIELAEGKIKPEKFKVN